MPETTAWQDQIGVDPRHTTQKSSKNERIVGPARVIDGDTIFIGSRQIRLEGIDAPESLQTCQTPSGIEWNCGRASTAYLSQLIGEKDVSCEKTGLDRYQRTLAVCHLFDGTNINEQMVREGFALAFVRYSQRYSRQEKEAKNAKRGLWSGAFQAPWDWRARSRYDPNTGSIRTNLFQGPVATTPSAKEEAKDQRATGCLIKGNINQRGDRIYHVPGSKWYDRTQINLRSGERWFCTISEAEAAGWRAPRSRN